MKKVIRVGGDTQELEHVAQGFGELITTVNRSLESKHRVISRVLIDGREITEEEEQKLSQVAVESLGDIEFEVANPTDLATETLNTLELYLTKLQDTLHSSAMAFEINNLRQGEALLVKAIDGLDLFVQTISGVKLAMRVGLHPRMALTEAGLVSIMGDILEYKRQGNYIYLAQILKQDLIGNLEEWKTDVFPLLKNFRSA